jgi:hypothetical protein
VPKTTTSNRRVKTTSTSKSPKTKPVTKAKKTRGTEKVQTPDDEVKIDRRRAERRTEQRPGPAAPAETAAPALEASETEKPVERRKVPRRRQIDPTTCERDYTDDEIEFMHALDNYKRANGRMFPTCSEVLEVVRNLGYVKTIVNPCQTAGRPDNGSSNDDEDLSEQL